jgi:erythromycin esterase-like protein
MQLARRSILAMNMNQRKDPLLSMIQRHARELDGVRDVEPIARRVGNANLVLLGEATHGTHEFYRLRAEITKRLIVHKGFDAVAVEADWPDALQASRYAQGLSDATDAEQALAAFERFPRWMWRNVETRDWLQWLRAHNDRVPDPLRKVGFFGLDLYSLHASVQAVLAYFDEHDPSAARQARQRYACFDGLIHDPQRYGYAARFGLAEDCEREVLQQLTALLRQAHGAVNRRTATAADERFYAQQNARVVRSAERYYRVMFGSQTESWNLRDRHMAETLQELRGYLSRQRGRAAKVVVWAHNSHIGDARATEMGERGELNLGQLVRERRAAVDEVVVIGFTTYAGTVAAASDWGEPVERKTLKPANADSFEGLLHEAGLKTALLPLHGELLAPLSVQRLERAVGVIYRPDSERMSHYFHAALSGQFDAVVHVDRSKAVTPLDPSTLWPEQGEPQTSPSGV